MDATYANGNQRQLNPALILIVASAGGPAALDCVLAGLPATLHAAVLVLLHLDPRRESKIADVLGRHCCLPVRMAHGGERLVAGAVHVAPPGRHLVVTANGLLSLTVTEPVHFSRPSADVLLTSAAQYEGNKYAVVLTGSGTDGADGVAAVKRAGGTVIAQNFESSEFFGMPGAAIRTGCVDHVVSLDQIAPLLVTLTEQGNDGDA